MRSTVIIGKNFGDEGKGLSVDYFAKQSLELKEKCLVIKHNGGAQAGHTVDLPGCRFVFHQLSSGSFRGADTYWNETYLPDFYKLEEELAEFGELKKSVPKLAERPLPQIYASPDCQVVLLDDVLINQALEESRGAKAHGSCGMGINEAVQRTKDGENRFSIRELMTLSEAEVYGILRKIRKRYVPKRLEALGIGSIIEPYQSLLSEDYVLQEEAKIMCQNRRLVQPVEDLATFLHSYDHLIFEGAQGLLLDDEYEKYAPYLTPSRTGCHNPVALLRRFGLLDEARLVYVTRSYVTRHGAGPIPYEITDYDCRTNWKDETNVPNPWQGSIRYGRHGSLAEFLQPIQEDLQREGVANQVPVDLMITHLNETNHKVWMADRPYSTEELVEITKHLFGRYIFSDCPVNL